MSDPDDLIRQAVARGWCHETTSHKYLDAVLAEAITQSVLDALPAVTDPQVAKLQAERDWLAESNDALTRKFMDKTEALNGPVIRYVFGKPLAEVAAILDGDETAKAERAKLIEALQWYGEQSRLARLIHSEGDPGRHALSDDGGKRARALLAELEAKA